MNFFHRSAYSFISIFFYVLGSIPGRSARFLADQLGTIWFRMDSYHRNIALENLNRAFGDEKTLTQINEIAKQTFINIAYIPFEIGWSLRLNEKKFKSFFTIHGGKRLREFTGKGQGVFLLTAHIGNWELLPIAGKMLACPISVESFIRRYPDQWFWVHRRWKNKTYRPWPRKE